MMENHQAERAYEEKRLKQTISLAEEQLKQAKEAAEKRKQKLLKQKKKSAKTQRIALQIYTLRTALKRSSS